MRTYGKLPWFARIDSSRILMLLKNVNVPTDSASWSLINCTLRNGLDVELLASDKFIDPLTLEAVSQST